MYTSCVCVSRMYVKQFVWLRLHVSEWCASELKDAESEAAGRRRKRKQAEVTTKIRTPHNAVGRHGLILGDLLYFEVGQDQKHITLQECHHRIKS